MRTSLVVTLVVLLAASLVYAQPDIMEAADDLKLTQQQMEKLQDMRLKHRKEMLRKMTELDVAEIELQEMMAKSKVDEKAVMEHMDKIAMLEADIEKSKMKQRLAMRNVLTDEQRSKWCRWQSMGRNSHMWQRGRYRCPYCAGYGHMMGRTWEPMHWNPQHGPRPGMRGTYGPKD